MTQEIERRSLRAFFQPFADQAHKCRERVHISHTGGLHGAGYVCEVNEAAVAKYSDGSNATTWIAFADVISIVVRDIDGRPLQELLITDGAPA